MKQSSNNIKTQRQLSILQLSLQSNTYTSQSSCATKIGVQLPLVTSSNPTSQKLYRHEVLPFFNTWKDSITLQPKLNQIQCYGQSLPHVVANSYISNMLIVITIIVLIDIYHQRPNTIYSISSRVCKNIFWLIAYLIW